jgi:predicted small secreted protein
MLRPFGWSDRREVRRSTFVLLKRITTMKSILAFATLLTVLLLSACNTISGMGDDIQAAGGAIKETAEETRARINKN